MPPHPVMHPAPGTRRLAHVGDVLEVRLRPPATVDGEWQARVRTTLGRTAAHRAELAAPITGATPLPSAALRDVPMRRDADGWVARFTLTSTGYHVFKAFLLDPDGVAHWPPGDDAALSVHPAWTRSGNTLYCAFPRMFGATRHQRRTTHALLDEQFALFDRHGYTVIPPSGTLRDCARELDHIVDRLGCRILHLLPVNPTPTTMARYGRYGSPYAALDLTAIDPALVEHDKRSTGIEQFEELADGVHRRDARLFLDLAINHTGWGSWLYERHPEWFRRDAEGRFQSPGAWGVTWEDLVELDSGHPALWRHIADAFLTWCRRGVDGFRCDAGYMVPLEVWRAIIARVEQEFPDTVFLLEGLGGAWEATDALLGPGRMQWAYSELFQNYSAAEIAAYNDHSLRGNRRSGLLFHYAETHDNDRLAARGRAWSLFRNRLCALLSHSGGYGFTCGVEWLADEKLQVHQSRGLNWGATDNLVPQLATLNRLLCAHPAFLDGGRCARVSPPDSPVYALHRTAADGDHDLLVLANPDPRREHRFRIPELIDAALGETPLDLAEESCPPTLTVEGGARTAVVAPLQCLCLGARRVATDSGAAYRAARARHAAAACALGEILPPERIGPIAWEELARRYGADPAGFLAAIPALDRDAAGDDLAAALDAVADDRYPAVVQWSCDQTRRVTPVPAAHWLLLRDAQAFRFRVDADATDADSVHGRSVPVDDGHAAWVAPDLLRGDATVHLLPLAGDRGAVRAPLRFLAPAGGDGGAGPGPGLVLLGNGRGGMARIGADLVSVHSKYDCVLGANLHPDWPVDRHVLGKRLRLWLQSDHLSVPLDAGAVVDLEPGPPAVWRLRAGAGAGRHVALTITANMLAGRNETVLRIHRSGGDPVEPVRLIARVDIEDRSFHAETTHNDTADRHFNQHLRPLDSGDGFRFAPADDRRLTVRLDGGRFHREGAWCHGIGHPVEAERGQRADGDAFSPGWFEAPLAPDAGVDLICTAEDAPAARDERQPALTPAAAPLDLTARLHRALDAYVVRRGNGHTVIAGYPWFLDWGRDTLICARGLLAAGRHEAVRGILTVFGAFERDGTLPNCIHGGDASNRETSDAALWFGVVTEELAAALGGEVYHQRVGEEGRDLTAVLRSIACAHLAGCPTGVAVDPDSLLVWSPGHFTWMDTNHPAGTPRAGYPIEIQVLWWRLLRHLTRIGAEPAPDADSWDALAARVATAIGDHFWLDEHGWWSDCLHAADREPAAAATADTALRSNCLHVVALDCDRGPRARRCVQAAARHLVVPGALRSLAPLPVSPPLHVRGGDGSDLIDPDHPYQGRYLGDEDTSRKPAYHNGTAWTWPFPVFCEALAKAWDGPRARAAARSYLGSVDRLLAEGCRGQIPEIVDGDAPHSQRGCDAQAWGVTEAVRVLHLLDSQETA